MGVVGTSALNWADIHRRMDPNGMPAKVVESLNKVNEFIPDVMWKVANDGIGNLTTRRSALPTISRRILDQGTAQTKSATSQVLDVVALYEANSEIDVDTLTGYDNPQAYRMDEDAAHTESIGQTQTTDFFYGDFDAYPDRFNGFAKRFNALADDGMFSAGGSASVNASIWIVGWGDRTVHGIYPKGTTYGIDVKDNGIQRVTDSNHRPYYAYCTNIKSRAGLVVADTRYVKRICNIDTTALATYGSSSDSSANLLQLMTRALRDFPSMNNINCRIYMNTTCLTWADMMLQDKANVMFSYKEFTGMPVGQLYFRGIPVRQIDDGILLCTEATIS